MSLRNSVVPAALAIAGCLPTESEPPPDYEQITYTTPEIGEACDVENVVHHVRGEVVQEGSIAKTAVAHGALLVTVSETASIVSCTEDLVTMAMPGAELATASFDARSALFALDVPARLVAGQHPTLRVSALLDANDNGVCDDGELVGEVIVDDGGLGDLAIALSDAGCALQQ
ncbi:MAG: hypothetical protein ABW252_21790 [Polyangiales bacterium]